MTSTHKPIIEDQPEVPVDKRFEKMMQDFLKKTKKDGIIEEVKRRRYYIKPSAAKRLRKNGKPKRSLQK